MAVREELYPEQDRYHDPVLDAARVPRGVSRVSVLIDYLGLLVGRPQNLLALGIRLEGATEKPVALEVSWSHAPKRDKAKESKKPGSFDVLLDAVRIRHNFPEY